MVWTSFLIKTSYLQKKGLFVIYTSFGGLEVYSFKVAIQGFFSLIHRSTIQGGPWTVHGLDLC